MAENLCAEAVIGLEILRWLRAEKTASTRLHSLNKESAAEKNIVFCRLPINTLHQKTSLISWRECHGHGKLSVPIDAEEFISRK